LDTKGGAVIKIDTASENDSGFNFIMPKHKRKEFQHGLFHMFGVTINVNTIVTTVLGSICIGMVSCGVKWVHDVKDATNKIPAMEAQITNITQEQKRVRREYHPETRPSPAASP
jgi:hypothetical protein